MKISIVLLGFLIFSPFYLQAKELKYKVSDIPKELKENARSVVRFDEAVFEITALGKGKLKKTFAITVLNNNGIEDARFQEFYDKFSRISGISARIYDQNGEIVRRIPADEIHDFSAISGYSIYEDNRMKIIDPNYRTVPFTFEYSYDETINGMFEYPDWSPYQVPFINISTEISSFKVIVPEEISINYKEMNLTSTCVKSKEGKNNVYFWEAKNLKALTSEPIHVPYNNYIPIVKLSPVDFQIEGYTGKLNSWQSFGTFVSTLNSGKNNLSEETKAEIRNLVKDASTDYEKVKILYEFMQNRSRYVSIQVGIGGWQPFDAATVHRLSFGDCKALANYMKTLLEVVGINSKYLLVKAGENFSDLIIDFPSPQFNHAFICVPQKTDTLWLECTSQRMPCGYIGDFTDDRDVLLIDGDSSKVVHTKIYTAKDNVESRVTKISFDSPNSGIANIQANYKGLNYEQILPIYLSDNEDKKRKIQNRINLPSFQLNKFDYVEHKAIIPSFDETLTLSFGNYGTKSGQRVFIPLNFINRLHNLPDRVRNRKTAVLLRRAYTEIDTVWMNIPKGYKMEALPSPVNIESKFGKYLATSSVIDGQICYTRNFLLNKGKYAAEEYAPLLEFLEQVSTSDNTQCVLTTE